MESHSRGTYSERRETQRRLCGSNEAYGAAKGFPDLFIPVAVSGFHGLFIELKRDRKARATDTQKAWLEYLNKAGYRATVCHGSEEAMREIENYFGGRKQ